MTDQVPHNVEAEEAVVGAILVSPEMYLEVSPLLAPEDFHLRKLRFIYETIEALVQAGSTVDIITVSEKLNNDKHLQEIGGDAYLTQLITNVPTSLHAPAYAQIVVQHSRRRSMLLAASAIAKLSYKTEDDVQDLIAEAQSAVADITLPRGTGPVPIKEAISDHYEYLDDIRQGRIVSIPTGLIDLDKIIAGGFKETTLNTVAAVTGMGKTAVACTLAKNMSKDHTPVFFSLEQPNNQIVSRLMAEDVGIPIDQFDVQGGVDANLQELDDAISKVESLNLYLDDTPGQNVMQICNQIKRLSALHGVDVAIIDYLQLIKPSKNYRMRYMEIKDVMEHLHITARQLGIPMILMAQLGREVFNRQNKRPVVRDLRESGDIEQFSYTITFLHREAYFDPSTLHQKGAELIVAKHRQGKTGTATVIFRGEYSRFENAALNVFTPPPPGGAAI